MALGKVASYIKNLGKSVAYASINEFDEAMPAVKEYREANANVAKEIYYAIKNFKGTVKKVQKYTQESLVYETASLALKNSFEDLKTGNFYNKERETQQNAELGKSMGFDFDENDDMFKDLDNMFNDDAFKDLDEGEKATIKSLEGTSRATANTIANATIDSAKYTSEVSKVNTNILFAQQERLFGQLNSGISTMNDNVNTINKFNMEVFQKHIENSAKFFESTTKNIDKIQALLTSIESMYRHEYDARVKISQENDKAMAARKHHDDDPMTYNQLVGSNGAVNFGEYITHVRNQAYKQINQYSPVGKLFGPEADENARNMVKSIASNPLSFLVESGIKGLMGPALKQSMSYFNDMVSGVFGTAMSRLNTWATNGDYETFGSKLKEMIGSVFGTADLKTKVSQTLNTSKYTKGPVPFDGITKKAIVDVIPELLGDILAELSGGEHRRYDYQKGTWNTLENLTRQDTYNRRASEREAESMFDHIMYNPDELALMAKGEFNQRAILEAYETSVKPWFQSRSGDIGELITLATTRNPEKAEKLAKEIWGNGISTAAAQYASMWVYKNLNKLDIMLAAHEYKSIIGRKNEAIKNATAETGVNMDRYVNNYAAETLGQRHFKAGGDGKIIASAGERGSSIFDRNGNVKTNFKHGLAFEVDEYNNNVFTYLQNIDTNLSGLFNTATNFALDYTGRNILDTDKVTFSEENKPNIKKLKKKLDRQVANIDKANVRKKTLEHFMDKYDPKVHGGFLDYNKIKYEDVAKNQNDLRNLHSEKTQLNMVYKIVSEDLDELSFNDINSNNIDSIIKNKQERLKYLQKHEKELIWYGLDIQTTEIKLEQDIRTLQLKRKYIIGTTRTNNNVPNISNSVLSRSPNKNIVDYTDKHIDDENYKARIDNVIAKAADKYKDYNSDEMVAIFERMLEANGEEEDGNGNYTNNATLHDSSQFYGSLDRILAELGEYGFEYDSPEGRMFVNKLKARWDKHYKIKSWVHDDYGKGNPIYRFTRGVTAENNLKEKYKGKEDFDWDEFEKKSFADKISSVETIGDKFDVLMMTVGRMVEVPAKKMSEVFTKAGDSIFNFFFNDDTEYIDKEGKRIKGFFGLMKAKTANALDSFVRGFDENIWKPIKEEFGLGVESLADSLGITWLTEKYGKATKNAFAQLGNNINDMFFGGIIDKAEKQYEKDKEGKHSDTTATTATTEEEKEKQEEERSKTRKAGVFDTLFEMTKDWEQIKKQKEDEVDNYATGARMINKSGLTAISKGEMIIPSEANPFYNGSTNKQAEISNEKKIKNGFGKYISNMIGMNAEGQTSVAEVSDAPTDTEKYVAILNNLKLANPKVYDRVMDIVHRQAGNIITKEEANAQVIDILERHKNDRTPEDQAKYDREIDARAEGTFLKRITSNMQASLSKVVLDTKNSTVISMWDDFVKNDKETVGNGIAGGTLGAIAGLITGFGPLAGMVVGAGANIVMGSESIKSTLFGERDAKGNRSGGALLSATEYKYLSKVIPDIGKFGLIGAGAGLVGLAPFGVLGGIGIGTMAALAKNNSSFMDSMFGDAGAILDKDKKAFLKKALPKMAIGTVAAYALGPFGILGSTILGSAGGMIATSERFKTLMLGDKLWTGERSGGLLGELKENFVSPLANFAKDFTKDMASFVYNDIIKPFSEGVGPIVRITGIAVKNTAKALIDGGKKLLGLGPTGSMLKDAWSYIASPIIKATENVAVTAVNKAKDIAKPIVSFPSKVVQKLGEKSNRWMLDNGYTGGMTAEERLAYRKDKQFGMVGKSSITADNDVNMLGLKDEKLVEAENLARFLTSNGKGTEKVLNQSKNKFKINLRSLLGVSDLTKEQEQIINDLLSENSDTRENAESKMQSLFKKAHLDNDKDVMNAYQTTVDVMRKQNENLNSIKTGGMDVAKKKFSEMGFKGDPAKVLELLTNEVKHRNIFGKLEEVAENQTPVDKQINATEQAGDKMVEQTKQSGEEIKAAVDTVGDVLVDIQEHLMDYIQNPDKYKKRANAYEEKLKDIEERIRQSAETGLGDYVSLSLEKKKLIQEHKIDNLLINRTNDAEVAVGKDVDEIMTDGEKHHFDKRDAIKLHKNYYKADFSNKIKTIKDNHLWTDSFNTIMNLQEDQFPLLNSVGKLHNDYAENESRWNLNDALSLNEAQVKQIDPLMKSGLISNKLSWYVDHKKNLKDFQTAVDEYNTLYNNIQDNDYDGLEDGEYTDIDEIAIGRTDNTKDMRRLAFMSKTINEAKDAKNSKDAHNILNAASFQMERERFIEHNPNVDRTQIDDEVRTVGEDGTPLYYVRTTDGSLKPGDKTTEEYIKNQKSKKWFDGNATGLDKVFGNTVLGGGLSKEWKDKKKSDVKHLGKTAGGLLGSVGGLFSTILGPILGGGGMIAAGALGAGYLLNKVPGLAEFAGNVLASGVTMLAKAAGSVFSYVINHASDIVTSVYNVIKDGLTGIVKVIFGIGEKSDEELKSAGIDKDENGYFKIENNEKKYLSQEELETAKARKSIFGAIGDVYNNANGWGKAGMIIGGGALAARQGYKAVKGAADWWGNVKQKGRETRTGWHKFLNAGRAVLGMQTKDYGDMTDTTGLPVEIAKQIEATDKNTNSIDLLTESNERLIQSYSSNGVFNPLDFHNRTRDEKLKYQKAGAKKAYQNKVKNMQYSLDKNVPLNLKDKVRINQQTMKYEYMNEAGQWIATTKMKEAINHADMINNPADNKWIGMHDDVRNRTINKIKQNNESRAASAADKLLNPSDNKWIGAHSDVRDQTLEGIKQNNEIRAKSHGNRYRSNYNTTPGAANTSIIDKVTGLIHKIPIVGKYLGSKMSTVVNIVKVGLSKAATTLGPKMASFSMPGIGQAIMIGMAAYGFYEKFSGAQELAAEAGKTDNTIVTGQGKYGRGPEGSLRPISFIGKCICGILGAIESIIGIPASFVLSYIPDSWLYSNDDESTTTTSESAAGKFGKGYIKQIDPSIANTRFNAKGDTQYQTIGDSGCGPIAAVNALYGTGPDPIEASEFALKNGYKEVNGGTKPGFFKSYFNKNGKTAEYTESNNNILKNLAAGNKVVLEGQSNKIDTDTPFGTGPHYVTATGLDANGNMIIQDPQDKRSNIAYDANKVLSKTKFGVAAKGKYGRGIENEYDKFAIELNANLHKHKDGTLIPESPIPYDNTNIAIRGENPSLADKEAFEEVRTTMLQKSGDGLDTKHKKIKSFDDLDDIGIATHRTFDDTKPNLKLDKPDIEGYHKNDLDTYKTNLERVLVHNAVLDDAYNSGKIDKDGNSLLSLGPKSTELGLGKFGRGEYDVFDSENLNTSGIHQYLIQDEDEDTSDVYSDTGLNYNSYKRLKDQQDFEKSVDRELDREINSYSTASFRRQNDTIGDLKKLRRERDMQANGEYIDIHGNSNLNKAWNFFKDRNFSSEATAGVLGNLMQESNLNPAIHEGYQKLGPEPVDGVGFGIAQWTFKDRQQALSKFAEKYGQPVNTIDPQLNFMYKEMKKGGPIGTVNIHDYENSIGDPGKYAYLFHKDFEISADSEDDVRQNRGTYADEIYNKFNVSASGKYGRGESEQTTNDTKPSTADEKNNLSNKFSSVATDIANQLLGNFGLSLDGKTQTSKNPGTNRSAEKVKNNIDKRAIDNALNWAEGRVNKPGEGNNGCTAFMNQFLAKANNKKNNWMWVPNIVQDAKLSKMWKDPAQPANPGDIAVLETNHKPQDGADHVVVATGDGGYIGNSSSRNKIWKGNIGSDFGANNVVGYVATGNPDSQGTVTTGKLTRTEKEVIGDSGTSAVSNVTTAASGKFGRGKFEPKASVQDFIKDDHEDYDLHDTNIDKVYENHQKNAKHATEQTALAGKGSTDYAQQLDQIITLLSEIATNTKGGTEISSKNSEALSRIAKQTAQAKRTLQNNPSGIGRITANDSIEDIQDMMGSLYKVAQR